MALRSIVALWLLFILVQAPLLQAEGLTINAGEQMALADFLYQEKEYYRAVSEYQRFLFFFGSDSRAFQARLQIGRALLAGGRFKEAISHLDQTASMAKPGQEAEQALMLAGLARLDSQANLPFKLRQAGIDKAMADFSALNIESEAAQRLLALAEDYRLAPLPPEKSPLIAGGLQTLLPGAGSFYLGRAKEAAYVFFITSLFSVASYQAYARDNRTTGALLGLVGLTFWGGGIYAAINNAHKINDNERLERLKKLRQRHGVWFVPAGLGIEARF